MLRPGCCPSIPILVSQCNQVKFIVTMQEKINKSLKGLLKRKKGRPFNLLWVTPLVGQVWGHDENKRLEERSLYIHFAPYSPLFSLSYCQSASHERIPLPSSQIPLCHSRRAWGNQRLSYSWLSYVIILITNHYYGHQFIPIAMIYQACTMSQVLFQVLSTYYPI